MFGSAPCQEVVLTGDDIDLGQLPIQSCWPGEPAPLITWPLVVTKGAGDKREDDVQPRHLPHAGDRAEHDAHALAQAPRRRAAPSRWQKSGKREPLPAAAVIGADPGTILAAVTPVPDTLSEYQFAGLLRGPRSSSSTARPCR
jgi:4-hydroxy-3-polyprenylbenzoate decarboxylase